MATFDVFIEFAGYSIETEMFLDTGSEQDAWEYVHDQLMIDVIRRD